MAAATCGALRITSPVARKPLGAPFGQVLKCAGKTLHLLRNILETMPSDDERGSASAFSE